MNDSDSLKQTRQLIVRYLRLLHDWLQHAEQGATISVEERQFYERYFGKDTPLATLSRLVGLHKSVNEMQADALRQASQLQASSPQPLSDGEWEMLEQAVRRWRLRQIMPEG